MAARRAGLAPTGSAARQQRTTLLDQARREGRVQSRRQDGSTFLFQPVTASRSLLDVPGVGSGLRPGELVALIREEREQSGERILAALSRKQVPPARERPASKKRRRRPAA